MPLPADPPPTGLRERKKAQTRALIQHHAFRLIRSQGYDATTIEQIAAAADVGQSTLFRYFPTKVDLVLQDDFDPLLIQAFRDQPPELTPIQALRNAIRATFKQLSPKQIAEQRERTLLVLSVPELRAATLDQLAQAMTLIAELIAERTQQSPNDLAVRALAGALVGVSIAAMFALADDPTADPATLLDQALAHLQTELRP